MKYSQWGIEMGKGKEEFGRDNRKNWESGMGIRKHKPKRESGIWERKKFECGIQKGE